MVVNSHSTPQEGSSAGVRRHQSQCSVCSHPQRQEIEDAWLNWANTTELADKYRLSRDALYRHMHALGCYSERQSRRKRLYENILERAQMTSFRGSDLVRILKEYALLCEREEANQAASVPGQEVLDLVPGQEAGLPAGDGSPLEEPTPQTVPEIEPLPATEVNEQGEPAVTPPASPEPQVLEAAVTNTVQ
jgi:hypothetical protein